MEKIYFGFNEVLYISEKFYLFYKSQEICRMCFCSHCYDDEHPERHTEEYELENHIEEGFVNISNYKIMTNSIMELIDFLVEYSVFSSFDDKFMYKFCEHVKSLNSIELNLYMMEKFNITSNKDYFYLLNY